jgi:hypothetical protein
MPDYAVNLGAMMELTREPSGLALLLLLKSITVEQPFCPVPGKDYAHQALPVGDDVSEDRWNAIVAIIRKKYSYQRFPLYRRTKRGWATVR